MLKDRAVNSMVSRNTRLLSDLLYSAFVAWLIGEKPCRDLPGPAAEDAVLFGGGLQ